MKQVILVILNDVKLIDEIQNKYDIPPSELFKLIYRNFEFVFNKCFITKIHNTTNNKEYAKRLAKGCRKFNRNGRIEENDGKTPVVRGRKRTSRSKR